MKRFLDLLISFLTLLILSPLLFIFMILIKIESPGPIFYKQERVGMNGNTFILLKLRSLKVNNNRKENQIFNEHPDMTKIGSFIRRFKIDELPQVYNVLIGEMSIVGPRPCLPSLLKDFDENAHHRLKVKPGLTGWAQVNGNVYNSWPKRWELDRYYVENQSLLFDFKIIIATLSVVLFGEEK